MSHLIERLHPDLDRRLDEPQRLHQVERIACLPCPLPCAHGWAERARRALETPVAGVGVVDAHHLVVHAVHGLPGLAAGASAPRSASLCQFVVAHAGALAVEDLRAHPALPPAAVVHGTPVRSYLGVPVLVGGQPVGTLCVADVRPRRWRDDDVARLGDLAEGLATEIALGLAEEESRRRASLLAATMAELEAMRDAAALARARLRAQPAGGDGRPAAAAAAPAGDDAAPPHADDRHASADPERVAAIGIALDSVLERGGLSLVAQPIVRCGDGALHGVEALLRWEDAELGRVGPDEFIPVAERTGAIVPIGRWVLGEACRAMARLERQGRAPRRCGINVSPRQLEDAGFAEAVADALARHRLGPERLVVEITETALLGSDTTTARTLAELADLGVRLVLDDFGTGFSSLSMLKDRPIDGIKVDRSFVSGLPADATSAAIVDGVLGMARALGRTVTAEGIETAAQLRHLRAAGCDYAQGWLLGRPAPFGGLGERPR